MVIHTGGCHCGRVRFQVEASAALRVLDCNCSICSMTGFLHLIVPRLSFRLLQGEDALALYTFGTHTARHLFCKICGIKSFYVPRSNPDGYSVNVRCLDPATIDAMAIAPFDGRNWEQHAAEISALSQGHECGATNLKGQTMTTSFTKIHGSAAGFALVVAGALLAGSTSDRSAEAG